MVTDLDARYGRKPTNTKRNIIVLASVLLVVFFGWAISVNFFTPAKSERITGELVKFDKVEQYSISGEIRLVTAGASGTVHCVSKALDSAYAIVGYKEFNAKANGELEKRFNLSINTTSKAASIVVEACKLQ
jgi:hypothetical protein